MVFMPIAKAYGINRIMGMKALLGLVDAVNGLEAIVVVEQGKLEEDFQGPVLSMVSSKVICRLS